MITIGANGNKTAYGIKHYNLDTDEDLQNLPKTATAGSTAFVINSSKHYMLNSQKEWVETKPYGNSIFDGDEDEEIVYDGGSISNSNETPEVEEIVYEGGNV